MGTSPQPGPIPPELPEKDYLNIEELSVRSGLSVSTLRRYVRDGKIECFQPGGPGSRLLFRFDSLERSLSSRTTFDSLERSLSSPPHPEITRTHPSAAAKPRRLPGRRPGWMTPRTDSASPNE